MADVLGSGVTETTIGQGSLKHIDTLLNVSNINFLQLSISCHLTFKMNCQSQAACDHDTKDPSNVFNASPIIHTTNKLFVE